VLETVSCDAAIRRVPALPRGKLSADRDGRPALVDFSNSVIDRDRLIGSAGADYIAYPGSALCGYGYSGRCSAMMNLPLSPQMSFNPVLEHFHGCWNHRRFRNGHDV
jgi:hypothetical protein